MKTLLLMDDSPDDAAWLRGILRDQPGHADEADSDCDAVLVVNRGGSRDVKRLQGALKLRENNPTLPIAVITPLHVETPVDEACAVGLSNGSSKVIPFDQFRELASSRQVDLRVGLNSDAVMFEYGD